MSRSTFRDAAGDVAWQRQLRDRHMAEGVPPVPHLDVKRAMVRPVSRRIAEQIILKYEWLGAMSAQTTHHYGLFFGAYCAGVCCVGVRSGGGINSHREFGITGAQMGVLARGACVHWAPPGANSKLIAWTCRLLARDTRLKILVAYSDTDAGEIGTVYQACNWVYIGRGKSTTQFVAPNGRIYDQKIVYDIRFNSGTLKAISWTAQRNALLSAGWHEQQSNPKHRYVSVLDKTDTALVDRVERMRQPYPKRAKHPSDAPAVQAGEGGAAPTRTLQEAAV